MAEELALKRAKINQGKEIDENKLNQGTDDGGLKFLANISTYHGNKDRERTYLLWQSKPPAAFGNFLQIYFT